MKIRQEIILPLALTLLSFNYSYAQGHFNTGIGFGPALSFPAISSASKGKDVKPIFRSKVDLHLDIFAQYLFKNKLGIETGFMIATKNLHLKTNKSKTYSIYLDSFSFPFLLLYKAPIRSTPYKTLNFLLGTTIEYQRYIDSDPAIVKHNQEERFVPNVTIGSRMSFKQGWMGKLELGLSFNYALKGFYAYQVDPDQGTDFIVPKMHFLKIDMIYFFLNRVMK